MNSKIRTIIVDDSAITRGVFEKAFKSDNDFEVIALLSNGRKALDYCSEHDVDLVLSDFDMPEMDGVEEASLISQNFDIPIVIYSENPEIRDRVLDAGAILFMNKPDLTSYSSKNMSDFISKIKSTVLKKLENRDKKSSDRDEIVERKTASGNGFKVLCIGASTGGPTAVQEVLRGLGNNFPVPILYAQHIDIGADEKMVRWFNQECPNTPMSLAKDGQEALSGHVYMAPADMHLVVDYVKDNGNPVLKISNEPPERFLRPAVNKLFRSAAHLYKKDCIAVLLTGMGRDGAEGCKEIVDNGGFTIAEDKSTCAVFGMPAAAIELDAASKILPRDRISKYILSLF